MVKSNSARIRKLKYLHSQTIYNKKNKIPIAQYQIGYREINRDRLNKYASKRYKDTRMAVLKIYSDGEIIQCVCHDNGCKEKRVGKMVIEHTKGKGVTRHTGMGNVSYYTKILKTQPKSLKVACQRCNASKRDGDTCKLHGTKF